MDTRAMGGGNTPSSNGSVGNRYQWERWPGHGKKTSWMPHGNCSRQLCLYYTSPWGPSKITELDLNWVVGRGGGEMRL